MIQTITVTERPDMTTSQLVLSCADAFPSLLDPKETKLDTLFPAPKQITTRFFLKSQEPDSEIRGFSIRDLVEQELVFGNLITLRERILLEYFFFKETGKRLDVQGLTFCSSVGSSSFAGSVPYGGWGIDHVFRVGFHYARDSFPTYGARLCMPK